nr:DUF6089 family protein [uncultured Flavobacterium sp.]
MKRLLSIIALATTCFSVEAQINELGLFAGGANYVGDVGPTTYIAPKDLSLGVFYRWNRSTRHSWRVGFTYGKITADDADSDSAGRKLRGYSFENSVKELSLALEFNFFEFNLHDDHFKWTPFLSTGIAYAFYNDKYLNANKEIREYGNGSSLAIPMKVGVKVHIARDWVVGLESGVRYSFTDNLDGSNPSEDRYSAVRFGNLESNDWYVFTGFTLSYTFGDKPCYCSD